MHLQAAIEGLQTVKRPLPINVYTTSSYLKDGATRWVQRWSAQNWNTKDGDGVRNQDLWSLLFQFLQAYDVNFYLVSKKNMPNDMAKAKESAKNGLDL